MAELADIIRDPGGSYSWKQFGLQYSIYILDSVIAVTTDEAKARIIVSALNRDEQAMFVRDAERC